MQGKAKNGCSGLEIPRGQFRLATAPAEKPTVRQAAVRRQPRGHFHPEKNHRIRDAAKRPPATDSAGRLQGHGRFGLSASGKTCGAFSPLTQGETSKALCSIANPTPAAAGKKRRFPGRGKPERFRVASSPVRVFKNGAQENARPFRIWRKDCPSPAILQGAAVFPTAAYLSSFCGASAAKPCTPAGRSSRSPIFRDTRPE